VIRHNSLPLPPGTWCEELVQLHASGEIVDHADETSERALGDDLEDLRRAVTGVLRASDGVVVDLAAAYDDLPCEVVDRGEPIVGGRVVIAHPLEVGLLDAEFAEDCRVEGDAVVVVDCDADGDTRNLTRGRVKPGGFDGATQTVEGAQQRRYWRRMRGKSQLELASDARTTPRYVSFVETGRAQASRRMVVRLASALDVPLRERNALLLAAGYAPLYSAGALNAPELDRVQAALTSMLAQHEPFPAVVMDRSWNVLRANAGGTRLFGDLLAPAPMPEPSNVLRLMIEPGPIRDAVSNWNAVVPSLLERARREAVGGALDAETRALVDQLRSRADVAALLGDLPPMLASVPVIDVCFEFAGAALSFFSVVSTIGTPIDITAQELRLEAFFPSDEETRLAWCAKGGSITVR
jgi:transcriptional regulator with XRE-family HTH domain